MFSTENYESFKPLTKRYILSKVSDYDIFKRYVSNFEDINKPFCSDLYTDTNPGCRIYRAGDGVLLYKDFGEGTPALDCFAYVQKKFNCNYYEAYNIIAADFRIGNPNTPRIHPRVVIGGDNDVVIPDISSDYRKKKTRIAVQPQAFTYSDYKYWNQYCIPLSVLEEYNISSAKYVFVNDLILEYSQGNPIYSYEFVSDGVKYYKIYRPYSDKRWKWLFNGTVNILEGYDQLPLFGELLIITSSLKDVMVLSMLGYNAISLQGEANPLSLEAYNKLSRRFTEIISLYDNDVPGIEGAEGLRAAHGIEPVFLPLGLGAKDPSDLIKVQGLTKAKEIIYGTISNRNRG